MQYANDYAFDRFNARMYSPRMSIGDRLDKAMKAAKITSQKDLERRSGVPQATISRILKGGGKKGPETDTIKKLATACGVSFDFLNEGVESGQTGAAPQPVAANDHNITVDEILELVAAYRDASQADRDWIMKSAKNAAKRAGRNVTRRATN